MWHHERVSDRRELRSDRHALTSLVAGLDDFTPGEPVTELALPTAEQARYLTDRIKIAVEGTWQMIQEAYTSRTWAVLGYDTWDIYCNAEFGQARLRLPREERQGVVASMRESGMSLRAISSATGISPATAMRDARVSDETPAEILGVDGNSYAAARPAADSPPAADPVDGHGHAQLEGPGFADAVTPLPPAPKAKRRPLPEAFTEAGRDLTRVAERLDRLRQDDRFAKNRDATRHQAPEIVRALTSVAELTVALDLPGAEADEEARRWWAASLHKTSDALRDVANSIQKEQ
jgi:hypothetical protein